MALELQKLGESKKEVEQALTQQEEENENALRKNLGTRRLVKEYASEHNNAGMNSGAEEEDHERFLTSVDENGNEVEQMKSAIQELYLEYADFGDRWKDQGAPRFETILAWVEQNQGSEDVDEEMYQLEDEIAQEEAQLESLVQEVQATGYLLEEELELDISLEESKCLL